MLLWHFIVIYIMEDCVLKSYQEIDYHHNNVIALSHGNDLHVNETLICCWAS